MNPLYDILSRLSRIEHKLDFVIQQGGHDNKTMAALDYLIKESSAALDEAVKKQQQPHPHPESKSEQPNPRQPD